MRAGISRLAQRSDDQMRRSVRRTSIGIFAGALVSPALAFTIGPWELGLSFGIALGGIYAASLRPANRAYADNLMAGAALGIPLWSLISVVALPIFAGQAPAWSAEGIRAHFPALVGWVLYGAMFGVINQGMSDWATAVWGPEAEPSLATPAPITRIVILGGGFAGMKTAQRLEELLKSDISVHITLVSETNALLFTPMLAEVAGSSLEPSHISAPLRSSLHRTEFVRARLAGIDLEKRSVLLEGMKAGEAPAESREIPYDQLVLALGAVSNYLGMPRVEELAFNFKTLWMRSGSAIT